MKDFSKIETLWLSWLEQKRSLNGPLSARKVFQELKRKKKRLEMAPVLTVPDEMRNLVIYSDTPHKGLEGVLMQHEKVVSYASK